MNQVSHALTIGSERAEGGSVASVQVGPDNKQIVMCGSETILAARQLCLQKTFSHKEAQKSQIGSADFALFVLLCG
jgi:hypothetical protein